MGLLNRLLFGNSKEQADRNEINNDVERIISTNFGINLDNITNSYYSRNKFYQSMYKLVSVGLTRSEMSAAIVGDYLEGMVMKSGLTDESTGIARRLIMFIEQAQGLGTFDKGRAERMFAQLRAMAQQYASRA